MMNGCIIPGTNISVDFWKIRDQPYSCLTFFLTHLHGDHIVGLTSSWVHPIYCTEITAILLRQRYGLDPNILRPLEVNDCHIITSNGKQQTTITVTVLDANHCPGAAMFLFEGDFGKILHTGDFRYSPDMFSPTCPLSLHTGTIDVVYLDNTFCSPACVFPSREEAQQEILTIIRRHPEHDIIVGTRHLGKEQLLLWLAQQLQEWISVSGEQFEVAKILDFPKVFKVQDSSCRIRTAPMQMICKRNMKKWNHTKPTIAILLTAIYTGIGGQPFASQDDVFVVPYSDHSSYHELKEFVSRLKPASLVPIVPADTKGPFNVSLKDRADMSVFDKYCTGVNNQRSVILRSGITDWTHSEPENKHRKPKLKKTRSNPLFKKSTQKGVHFESPDKSQGNTVPNKTQENGGLQGLVSKLPKENMTPENIKPEERVLKKSAKKVSATSGVGFNPVSDNEDSASQGFDVSHLNIMVSPNDERKQEAQYPLRQSLFYSSEGFPVDFEHAGMSLNCFPSDIEDEKVLPHPRKDLVRQHGLSREMNKGHFSSAHQEQDVCQINPASSLTNHPTVLKGGLVIKMTESKSRSPVHQAAIELPPGLGTSGTPFDCSNSEVTTVKVFASDEPTKKSSGYEQPSRYRIDSVDDGEGDVVFQVNVGVSDPPSLPVAGNCALDTSVQFGESGNCKCDAEGDHSKGDVNCDADVFHSHADSSVQSLNKQKMSSADCDETFCPSDDLFSSGQTISPQEINSIMTNSPDVTSEQLRVCHEDRSLPDPSSTLNSVEQLTNYQSGERNCDRVSLTEVTPDQIRQVTVDYDEESQSEPVIDVSKTKLYGQTKLPSFFQKHVNKYRKTIKNISNDSTGYQQVKQCRNGTDSSPAESLVQSSKRLNENGVSAPEGLKTLFRQGAKRKHSDTLVTSEVQEDTLSVCSSDRKRQRSCLNERHKTPESPMIRFSVKPVSTLSEEEQRRKSSFDTIKCLQKWLNHYK